MKKMTKKEMIEAIEKSGMVINFSHSYFMHRSKDYVEDIYLRSQQYVANKKGA